MNAVQIEHILYFFFAEFLKFARRDIIQIYKNYDYKTEIIVAAVRNGSQIGHFARLGADIVTCGLDVYKNSFAHPFTDYGLGIFRDAWDQTAQG